MFKKETLRFSIRKNKIYGTCSVFLGLALVGMATATSISAEEAIAQPTEQLTPKPVDAPSNSAPATEPAPDPTPPSPVATNVAPSEAVVAEPMMEAADVSALPAETGSTSDLDKSILNDKQSLIWFDYNAATLLTEETPPANGKYTFKHTVLKEGMIFEQEIKDHPFLAGAKIRVEVTALKPFTGTEEFKNRLDKYNNEHPEQKLEISPENMENLSKNMFLWDHNKDKGRISKGAAADIVLRDADRKWSNLFNALNNGVKIDNVDYDKEGIKNSINIPDSVLGSINEAANIGAEFKITLIKADGTSDKVTLIAADAEEANYSEAILFNTKGDGWKKLAEISFEGTISDKKWSKKPGQKELSKPTPIDSTDEDVHTSQVVAISDKHQKGNEEFIELNYLYGKTKEGEEVSFENAKAYAKDKTKLPETWSKPEHISKLITFAKELAVSDAEHWSIDDKETVTRTYYDTLKTRFQDDEIKILRPAHIQTPAVAWISPEADGGLGTQWFGPVLTAQDYRTVPIIYSENTDAFGIYIASTGAQQAIFGILSPGGFQEHHAYVALDFDGSVKDITVKTSDVSVGKNTEQFSTQKQEDDRFTYVSVIDPKTDSKDSITSAVLASDDFKKAVPDTKNYLEGKHANGEVATDNYLPGKKQEVSYLYTKQPGRFQDTHRYYIDYTDANGMVIRREEVIGEKFTNSYQEGFRDEAYTAKETLTGKDGQLAGFAFDEVTQVELLESADNFNTETKETTGNFVAGQLQEVTYHYVKTVRDPESLVGSFQEHHDYYDVTKNFEGDVISRQKNPISHSEELVTGKTSDYYTTEKKEQDGYVFTTITKETNNPVVNPDGSLAQGSFEVDTTKEVTYEYEKAKQPGRFQDTHRYYIDYVDADGTVIRSEEASNLTHTNQVQEDFPGTKTFQAELAEQDDFIFTGISSQNLDQADSFDPTTKVTSGDYVAGQLQTITYDYHKQMRDPKTLVGSFQENHIYQTINDMGEVVSVDMTSHGQEISGTPNETYQTSKIDKDGYTFVRLEQAIENPTVNSDGSLAQGQFVSGKKQEITYVYQRLLVTTVESNPIDFDFDMTQPGETGAADIIEEIIESGTVIELDYPSQFEVSGSNDGTVEIDEHSLIIDFEESTQEEVSGQNTGLQTTEEDTYQESIPHQETHEEVVHEHKTHDDTIPKNSMQQEVTLPETGDSTGIVEWMGSFVLSALALVYVFDKKKKH
ncbi:MucBP domain-containing protein [Streptococcus phocae]|uniref:MucBP domain-containing protein n=1 Tax=Streptococcus phocae TaxID=119224 RepID=A0A0P6S187_9STRE|nr:MucBP domain-containing protein [Streptococcus phocae]KPJ21826.1 hypothetical protein AKK44_07865 [Streptococcus phocae]